jgi:hypothetical protein
VHDESLGGQTTTSMEVLEASICTFLGGPTHVGRSMTVEIQQSFFLLLLLFSLLSSGIMLACKKKKTYPVICFFLIKFVPYCFDYYFFLNHFID